MARYQLLPKTGEHRISVKVDGVKTAVSCYGGDIFPSPHNNLAQTTLKNKVQRVPDDTEPMIRLVEKLDNKEEVYAALLERENTDAKADKVPQTKPDSQVVPTDEQGGDEQAEVEITPYELQDGEEDYTEKFQLAKENDLAVVRVDGKEYKVIDLKENAEEATSEGDRPTNQDKVAEFLAAYTDA